MKPPMSSTSFGASHAKLDDSAATARQGLERFFNELSPRLDAARTVECELDRRLARKFNAFDYLRPDEQQLSKLIANLLDPKGKHGQGAVFLRRFLDLLGTDGLDRIGDLRNSRVETECVIKNQRRLDIVVQLDNRRCVAIENKPWAGDQPDQIKDYLDWLRGHYDKFLLLYLSRQGEPPSEDSVKPADLQGEAGKSLRIMPYHHRAKDARGDDDFERTGFGLTDWLRECRAHCDVERLRWFLREAETYCEKEFGGSAMTTGEHKIVKDFVLEGKDDRNWTTALAIGETLPEIHAAVRRQFLESIADCLTKLGYTSESNYADKQWKSWVRACLPQWREYQTPEDPKWSRTCIAISNGEKGGNDWIIGILSPLPKSKMSDDDRKRRRIPIEDRLDRESKKKTHRPDDEWPWYEYVDERYRHWDSLVPAMHRELQQDGGKITDYFVRKFKEIAEVAKPILDDIEGSRG